MACTGNTIHTYNVYAYDAAENTHKSDKIFVLDKQKVIAQWGSLSSQAIVITFFSQMFDTINTTSGFSAIFEGRAEEDDIISIRWKVPHWKLVKIK